MIEKEFIDKLVESLPYICPICKRIYQEKSRCPDCGFPRKPVLVPKYVEIEQNGEFKYFFVGAKLAGKCVN